MPGEGWRPDVPMWEIAGVVGVRRHPARRCDAWPAAPVPDAVSALARLALASRPTYAAPLPLASRLSRMFVVWLIGLVLAVLAPVALGLALWNLRNAATRPAAARALLGAVIGGVAGLGFSMVIEFISERRATGLVDYWYAYVAAGVTLGVGVAMIVVAVRAARARAASAF